MKIHLTKKEYRLLLDILSIADWVMHAYKTEDDLRTDPYRKLEQKFMSYAKDFGYEDLIVYEKKFDKFFPTRKYEDQETERRFIDEYDEEVFWEELEDRMAQRDLIREKGRDKLMKMSPLDRMNAEYQIAEKYNREFTENGLKNLIIDQESREKPLLPDTIENGKDPIFDDYNKLKNEIKVEQVNEIFRKHPDDFVAKMEELGFEYFEDDVGFEELEEKNAKPENQRQKDLVDFFEGKKELSEKILESFSEEKASATPNYPLIRKYFKEANQNLKALLLYGLNNYSGRLDFLSDLAFFHEYENVLTTLIDYYTRACREQANLETFTELAKDFYYSTNPDGYEALYALRELFEPSTEKRQIIDFLIAEEAEGKGSQPMDHGTSWKH